MKPKIVVERGVHPKAIAELEKSFEVRIHDRVTEVPAEDRAAAAIIVRLTRVDGAVMGLYPGLKAIGRNGAGVDNVDVPEATRRGVAVVNAPGANAAAVAEYTIGAILVLHKSLLALNDACHRGEYAARKDFPTREVGGKTIGIVGFGNVGKLVGRLAKGFGMRVMAYDPYLSPEARRSLAGEAEFTDELPALLKAADFVTIHVPLVPETRNLFGAAEMKLMKPDAILVNVARGGIVDEAALADALSQGQLGGAALDVLLEEPFPKSHPLYGRKDVLLTPHVAGMAQEAMERISLTVAGDIARLFSGQRPVHLVNGEVLR